jgi:hypothetical protein
MQWTLASRADLRFSGRRCSPEPRNGTALSGALDTLLGETPVMSRSRSFSPHAASWWTTPSTYILVLLTLTQWGIVKGQGVKSDTKAGDEPQAVTDPEDSGLPKQTLMGALHFYDKASPKKERQFGEAGIYPKAGSNRDNEFFLCPIFAVFSIETLPSPAPGMKAVSIRYTLSNSVALEAAANELMKRWSIKGRLWAWPVTGRMVYVLKTRTNQQIAKTTQIVSSRDQIEFIMDVPEKTADVIISQPKLFVADVYYTARALRYATGRLTVTGSKNISMALKDTLQSRDPKFAEQSDLTGQLVIGDELADLNRRVSALVEKTIEAENPDVLTRVEAQVPVLVDRLIANMGANEISYDTLITQMNRDAVDAALTQYLLPRIQTINSNKTGEQHELKLSEKGSSKSSGVGGTIQVLSLGLTGAKEETKQNLERLEQGTGMSWQYSASEAVYKPHKIKVSRVRKGYDTVEFNESTIVYLPLAPTTGFQVSANMPLNFGLDEAVESLREQALSDLVDHGIGSVVLSMSDQPINRNWVSADGKTTFPNESRVPPHLRGLQVPNLQDSLIAGAGADLATLGKRMEGSLHAQTVNGSSFSLPAVATKQMYAGEGNAVRKGGMVGIVTANGDYTNLQNGLFWGIFGGKMDGKEAVYEYHPQGTATVGAVSVLPPTHTFLRAYIRIR